jgi:quercetin 2,3-dioxygenase
MRIQLIALASYILFQLTTITSSFTVYSIPHPFSSSSSTTTTTTTAAEASTTRPSTSIKLSINTDHDICPVTDITSHSESYNNNGIMKAPITLRSVQKVLPRPNAHWVGDGFRVYPVFSNLAFTNEVSPLLMFDYAEPRHFPPQSTKTTNPTTTTTGNKPLGVGQHPHRGFETVTIAFQGEVEHHDNAGNSGIIYPGDVQWMTAGRGIIHEEYHSQNFTKTGGTFEMCQLWVNLPKKDKMTKPTYQGITNEQIPIVNLPLPSTDSTTTDEATEILGTARIIAGELGETTGAAKTFSPVQVWDVSTPTKDSIIDIPYPPNQRCMIFVRRGSVEVMNDGKSGKILQAQEVGILRQDNSSNTIRIRVVESNSSILILGGEPLDEPIAAQGPFVMNTQDEIHQAMSDYRSGKFAAQ